MSRFLTFVLCLSGIVHVLPLAGVLGTTKLQALYGVTIDDANLVVLMRHRALLFGLIGSFAIFAAFREPLQLSALIISTVSVAGFILIALPATGLNAPMLRVFRIDIALLLLLVPALILCVLQRRH
ncbi:MAG: phosphopantetheine adenylyltransferase [Pseudomonadota bacterium]